MLLRHVREDLPSIGARETISPVSDWLSITSRIIRLANLPYPVYAANKRTSCSIVDVIVMVMVLASSANASFSYFFGYAAPFSPWASVRAYSFGGTVRGCWKRRVYGFTARLGKILLADSTTLRAFYLVLLRLSRVSSFLPTLFHLRPAIRYRRKTCRLFATSSSVSPSRETLSVVGVFLTFPSDQCVFPFCSLLKVMYDSTYTFDRV